MQEGDCVLDCLLLLFSSSALPSVPSLLVLRFFLRLLVLLLSGSCAGFLFRCCYRSCCSFRLCALLKEVKEIRETFTSSRSLSPSFVSLLNFSQIVPHHPSCFALMHRCWNMTVALSRTFVFPQSSHRRSSSSTRIQWRSLSCVRPLLCSLARFLSLSWRFCAASISRLVDPRLGFLLPVALLTTRLGVSTSLPVFLSQCVRLQPHQASRVLGRLSLLLLVHLTLQLLDP